MYFPDLDDNEEEVYGDEQDSEYPLNSTARVAPMLRDAVHNNHNNNNNNSNNNSGRSNRSRYSREEVSITPYHDEARLMDNERGQNSRTSQNSYASSASARGSGRESDRELPPHLTKNYYNTTINNPRSNNNNNNGGDTDRDNVGIVKPNNSRTMDIVDVQMQQAEEPRDESGPRNNKKKKKGFMNMFKLCSGKSGQPMARESIYHKKKPPQPARVTLATTTYDVDQ